VFKPDEGSEGDPLLKLGLLKDDEEGRVEDDDAGPALGALPKH
jgi:hypothetical protein